MASESELIAVLTDVFQSPTNKSPSLILGIGDDGAILDLRHQKSVAVTDMAVENVHFRRAWSSLADIGGKVTAANLADIYAMGGEPTFLLVAAGLPADFSLEQMRELAHGIQEEADQVGALVVGGDLTRSETIIISISALGKVEIPIVRSGACEGDRLIISAMPGWAAAGLALFHNDVSESSNLGDLIARAKSTHRKPSVNYLQARSLVNVGCTAMCDVSDGLLSEATHIANSSQVKIVIDTEAFTYSQEYHQLTQLGQLCQIDPWEWILAGGEDHAFLATISPTSELPSGFIEIGYVSSGSGVSLLHDLHEVRLNRYRSSGFSHFEG
ncbi:MAG: thiamine-phosphate kinase [Actinomycetes bacterium]|jgi:thiamine-monophosphate kinase